LLAVTDGAADFLPWMGGLNFDSRVASNSSFPNPCSDLRRGALPPKKAKLQSEANGVARFHARGEKTQHEKMPFVPARQIEGVNSAVKLNE
jgi:hypothetical protein